MVTATPGLTGWFTWVYYQTGQPLFGWHPPNGYPDSKFAWNTTSPRVMTWRIANMLVTIWDEDADDYYFDLVGRTPAGVLSAQAIVDFWSVEILGRALPAAEEGPLVSFMAQGADPDADLPLGSNWETDERLRSLVALLLMWPDLSLEITSSGDRLMMKTTRRGFLVGLLRRHCRLRGLQIQYRGLRRPQRKPRDPDRGLPCGEAWMA